MNKFINLTNIGMKRNIHLLMQQCLEYMTDKGYSAVYMKMVRSMWKRCLIPYMELHGISDYTPEVGKNLLQELFSTSEHCQLWHDSQQRYIRFLDDYLTLGYIRCRYDAKTTEYGLEGKFGVQVKDFIEYKRQQGLSDSSMVIYTSGMVTFYKYCINHGVTDVQDLSLDFLYGYISSHSRVRITCLRLFMTYLYDTNALPINFALVIGQIPKREYKKIPAIYTKEEIEKIERSVNRNSHAGKRNYAMLLLASRLGMRAEDIAQLQLTDIKWDKGVIEFSQHKTEKMISLPLLADVGNAIVDYIKYARPKEYKPTGKVFLRAQAPFDEVVSSRIVCNVVRAIINRSGIMTRGRKKGAHSMRHSLATNLLGNGVLLPTISSILGHSSTDSTKHYLGTDITTIMKCALPVTPVDQSFYDNEYLYL